MIWLIYNIKPEVFKFLEQIFSPFMITDWT